MKAEILQGDALEQLKTLPSGSVHCCVTSPPYYGLRSYLPSGHADKALEVGTEQTPECYIERLVTVFREVRRVLRNDGVLWVNIADTYAANRSYQVVDNKHTDVGNNSAMRVPDGLKPKDLIGIPWMLAFALRADGWYLRSDIIWAKPNPMPESVTDRPTKAHEYLFLLSKSERYYYDADAIKESFADERLGNPGGGGAYSVGSGRNDSGALKTGVWTKGHEAVGRNKRSVWTVSTKPYADAHFAVFPPDLIKPCILAGAPEGGTVLDPFAGSGTTLWTANSLCRHAIGIELNGEYVTLIRKRLAQGFLDWTEEETL